MGHDTAKLLLERAVTPEERTYAVEAAQGLGMPLSEIEEYLDWLDCLSLDTDGEEETAN